MKLRRFFYILGASVLIVVLTLTLSNVAQNSSKTAENEDLPTVGSFAGLKSVLTKAQNSGALAPQFMAMETAAASEPKGLGAGQSSAARDYSQTNVQVSGVDEADIIKTDGQYIYQVSSQKLVISQVYPSEDMQVLTNLKFDPAQFNPLELYVDDRYLILIGNSYIYDQGDQNASTPPAVKPELPAVPRTSAPEGISSEIYPYIPMSNTTKAIVYDLSDRANLKKVREIELEGQYISSRKIDSALYLVTNKYLDYYQILEQNIETPTPTYRDSAAGEDYTNVGYDSIHYFPDSVDANYLMIGSLDLNQPDQELQVSTYLGAGQNIYASENSLYVAITRYETEEPAEKPANNDQPVSSTEPSFATGLLPMPMKTNTVLYKFALDPGKVSYLAKGEVPGTVLNQFSMDEDNGYFRIATTKGAIWGTGENTSKNNIYVLDKDLKQVGQLEDIAPGENIYSVRFVGERAYMVTFRTVDPLFVIDLAEPTSPRILGALKIPGYSDYLHPYDENHIIGFGKETIEVPQTDGYGNVIGTTAYYQGMKVALFDVSDVTQPKELFKETIGDRGTDSELLYNHKALLFDKDKNLLAFPVTVMEINDASYSPEFGMPYGEFAFQGAYVYNLDLVNGFTLKGKISHPAASDQTSPQYDWYYNQNKVERVLYIEDTLYTISQSMIKASDLTTLKEKNSLVLPQ